jgi:hypothetical protein
VAVPAQIFPCVDIDLSREVSGRQFKNIFPRRGDEISRALVGPVAGVVEIRLA